jgi:hypothetical protein
LDTKIKSRSDVDGKTPFIGDVPNSETPSVLMKGGSSSSAEAIRIVKTNLEFMLSTVSEAGLKLY